MKPKIHSLLVNLRRFEKKSLLLKGADRKSQLQSVVMFVSSGFTRFTSRWITLDRAFRWWLQVKTSADA